MCVCAAVCQVVNAAVEQSPAKVVFDADLPASSLSVGRPMEIGQPWQTTLAQVVEDASTLTDANLKQAPAGG